MNCAETFGSRVEKGWEIGGAGGKMGRACRRARRRATPRCRPSRALLRYDLAYALALPALMPYLAWRRLARGKYAESAGGMLGRRLPPPAEARRFADGSLWIHAVSVGEVQAARVVADGLQALAPRLPLVISTITETGQAAARRLFPDAVHTYYPVDFSVNVERFQRVFNPRLFVLLESDLWPNFLAHASRRGTRCVLLNADISDRSFPRYLRFRRYLGPALGALDAVCAQTEVDAERFTALGVAPARIRVTGNCKLDLPAQVLDERERRELCARFGLNPERRWIVAGSTHEGEEALILRGFAELRREMPGLGLLIAPRHPERFAAVEQLARDAAPAGEGWRVGAASRPEPASDPDVVVLDAMGVLARSYGLGAVAIVAGSFCPTGGHNLLEAAAHGVPVVYGPDMHSQREIDRLFKSMCSGLQVRPDELHATLRRLLTDEAFRAAEGRKALQVLERNQGSARRTTEAAREILLATGRWP